MVIFHRFLYVYQAGYSSPVIQNHPASQGRPTPAADHRIPWAPGSRCRSQRPPRWRPRPGRPPGWPRSPRRNPHHLRLKKRHFTEPDWRCMNSSIVGQLVQTS